MPVRTVIVLWLCGLWSVAAWAGTAAVQQPAQPRQVFSVTVTCFYGPHLRAQQARHLCSQQGRGKLLDAAVAGYAKQGALLRAGLSQRERRAFVDSLLAVTMLNEEMRKVADGRAVRLTLRGEEKTDSLDNALAAFRADAGLRAQALSTMTAHDQQAAAARIAAIPFEGEREFASPPLSQRMSAETAFATRRLVPGMSITSVKELLGDPATIQQSLIDADTYVCAAYGRIWLVFRDGVLACLRTRLEYDARFGSTCHCGGHAATLLNTN